MSFLSVPAAFKGDLSFNIKTNFYYLNKNLVYPNTILIADLEEEAKKNAKLKKNVNDDLSLRYSSNKTERLMYLRKKALNPVLLFSRLMCGP